MRTLLITNSNDTKVGMRLAGIDAEIVNTADEALDATKKAIRDQSIGLILLSDQLAAPIYDELMALKLTVSGTIIMTIPDEGQDYQDHIGQYVSQSIGIKY